VSVSRCRGPVCQRTCKLLRKLRASLDGFAARQIALKRQHGNGFPIWTARRIITEGTKPFPPNFNFAVHPPCLNMTCPQCTASRSGPRWEWLLEPHTRRSGTWYMVCRRSAMPEDAVADGVPRRDIHADLHWPGPAGRVCQGQNVCRYRRAPTYLICIS
jgi:hypothetical protein